MSKEVTIQSNAPLQTYGDENGKIGVIVSPGYGAGWSTRSDPKKFLCMDRGLVRMKINGDNNDKVKKYLESVGLNGVCMGGWSSAVVEWVSKGDAFRIEEYDGFESLVISHDIDLMLAE